MLPVPRFSPVPGSGSNRINHPRESGSIIRDGSTPAKAMLSAGLHRNVDEDFIYLVSNMNRWVLANGQEAREWHSFGFRVYSIIDSEIAGEVGEWTHPLPGPSTERAYEPQMEEVYDVEDVIEEETDAGRYTVKKGMSYINGSNEKVFLLISCTRSLCQAERSYSER